ncbi:hypothetical protein BCR35DRAFT_304084 [Leucosporidium creatinivorum]|uniref:Fungal lipase-type domain-containing protein n=1 Tax=Leucosporidium creatinivorum TaxID=106004 RepID=A0A1Y2FCU3_9BASI|nr:hypothetical protein BCR35DRAFT_304084 [Leucosporidium creatinivorum]
MLRSFLTSVALLAVAVCAQDTTASTTSTDSTVSDAQSIASTATSTSLASASSSTSTGASDTTVSDSQYWHERYHGILSMAIYGDYATLCPQQTFTQAGLLKSFPDSTAEPWTVVEEWGPTASGLEGITVVIPEMDKVVMVFKGIYGWEQFNMTATPIGDTLNLGCANCTAHAGAVTSYLEAKEATNDWAIMKQYVESTGAQWSITGHAFGGMVAQVAALDLGWRGLCHWSHSHGAPRVFNPASANLYNSLFGGEAGQRTVANEDSVPTIIPESDDYTFTLEGFHIFGTNATYGMSYTVCQDDPTDPECAGGNVATDSLFYYTPIGQCGSPNVKNWTQEAAVQRTLSSEFYATATSTYVAPSTSTSTTSTSSSASSSASSAGETTTAASSVEGGASAAAADASSAEASSTPASGATSIYKAGLNAMVALGVVSVGLMVLA